MAVGNGEERKREDSKFSRPKDYHMVYLGRNHLAGAHPVTQHTGKFGPGPPGLRPMFNDTEKFCLGLKRKSKPRNP